MLATLVGAMAAAAMTPQAVVEAKFAAVNRHDVAAIVALYAPDAVITASDFCAPRKGRTEVERIYRGIFAAVPDAQARIDEYISQDDRVAVRFSVVSRLPGRAFELPIQDVFTVRDGLIVRDAGIFDNGGRACTP